MATQLRLRRGNTVQTNAFTGAMAEVTVDTDKYVIVVHDGSTPGGYPAATLAYTEAAFAKANAAFSTSNSDISQVSAHANAAFLKANSSYQHGNASFNQANASYDQANSASLYANGAFTQANGAFDAANTKLETSGGTITGSLQINTDLNVYGKALIGNGVFTILPNTVTQFTGSSPEYIQVNMENLDANGSSDFVTTSDNGTDTTYYTDLGKQGSNRKDGDILYPNDSYLISKGDDDTLPGSNLVIAQITSNVGDIVFAQGGLLNQNEVARFVYGQGLHIRGGIEAVDEFTGGLVIQGGAGIQGNVHASDVYINGTNVSSLISSANSSLQSYVDGQVTLLDGVNTTQNTRISSTSIHANSAYDKANSANVLAQEVYDFANTRFSSNGGIISGDTTVTGNLTVTGTTFYANTENLFVEDNIITLNSNVTGTPTLNAGIEINRGNQTNTSLFWNESNKAWQFTNDGTQYSNIASASAETYANGAFSQANASYEQANSAALYANGAFVQANAAFQAANNVAPQIEPAFSKANAAFIKANSAYESQNTTGSYANSAYDQANTATNNAAGASLYANGAFVQANSAYESQNTTGVYANSAYIHANAAFIKANSAYESQNTTGIYANSAYNQANTATNNAAGASLYANGAFIQANAAFIKANSAYDSQNTTGSYANTALAFANSAGNYANSAFAVANDALPLTGGTINGSLLITQDLSVTGNLAILGNTSLINTSSFTVQDTLFILGLNNYTSDLLDIGFSSHYNDGQNAHTGLIRDASEKQWMFFEGYTPEVSPNNDIIITDPSFKYANVRARDFTGNVIANTVVTNGYDLFTYTTNSFTHANSAYDQANSAANYANSAFGYANSAYNKANNALANTTGTFDGDLTISGNLIVNGANVALGNVGSVHIYGGNTGQLLTTNGLGSIDWIDLPTPNTVTYTANSLIQTNGVYVSGNLWSTQVFGDYLSANGAYVLTDGTGSAPAWYIDFDFINVVKFNRVVMNINYTQNSGHTIYVQLYNFLTSTWDNIGTYTGLGSYYAFALEVIDETDYVDNTSKVQLRLYHSNGGSASHQTSIDYIALEQSYQGPQGPRGPTGATGATGATGPGVASGGTVGQVLIKNSSTNYDTSWSNNLINAYDGANSAGSYANSAFEFANSSGSYANSAFGVANSASTYANGAFIQANSAYTRANNSLNANTGGTITGDVSITGNLIVNGTTTYINTDVLEVEDSLIKLADNNTTGDILDIGFYGQYFSGSNNYTGLVKQAGTNNYLLFKGLTQDPGANTLPAGSATAANVATLIANVAGYSITSNGVDLYLYTTNAYTQANTGVNNAGGASLYANGAFIQANAVYNQSNTYVWPAANSAGNYANSAFAVANSSSLYANGAFIQANAVYNQSNTYVWPAANSAGSYANSAFLTANNALPKAGGQITGAVSSNSPIFSSALSANTTVTINTYSVLESTTITTASVAQVTLDSFSASTYRSAKYLVQMTSGSSYHMIELSLIHDGTTVYLAQYGEVKSGSSLGTLDASITSGTLNVLFTPTNAVTTVRAAVTIIPV